MKIENSTIGMVSQHASSRQITVEESLRAWVGQKRPDFKNPSSQNLADAIQFTIATISAAGRAAAAKASASTQAPVSTQAASDTTSADAASQSDPRMQLLISLIEALTGRKVKLFSPEELKHAEHAVQTQQAAAQTTERRGWGMEYDRHEKVHESEQTSFAAQGVIGTSDGKEIQFNLSLQMQREFTDESNVSVRAGDAVKKDPLVINFGGTAAQLTDAKFSFDLNSDGKPESVSFVGSGSGFLALDKNDNGAIDNGSELFGTKSGNGFADLAAYDSDKNGWIDENDAVYSKLKILTKDTAGKDTLSTLAQHNIGALYLGNVATPFDVKNSDHALQGQVKSSGIYLHEDGSAGTLQQVDLVV